MMKVVDQIYKTTYTTNSPSLFCESVEDVEHLVARNEEKDDSDQLKLIRGSSKKGLSRNSVIVAGFSPELSTTIHSTLCCHSRIETWSTTGPRESFYDKCQFCERECHWQARILGYVLITYTRECGMPVAMVTLL